MRKYLLRQGAVATLLPTLWALPSALAQEPAPGAFSEVIDVRVINLEIVVTDRSGTRVTGLGPEDFILTVDREEVPIEYFTEIHGGTAVVRGDEMTQATVPAVAPGQPVGTSYLVFIDEYFTVTAHRNQVLRSLIEQLPNLAPEDRMAVVAFNGKELEMLSTWSRSVESLTRVFNQAQERPTFGLQLQAELRSLDARRELLDRGYVINYQSGLSPQLTVEEEQLASILKSKVDNVVLASTAALRSFARPPGRKVMLLLAGNWPHNVAQWVVDDPDRTAFVGMEYGEDAYARLIDTANRLSYTLYPVHVPGLRDETSGIEYSSLEEVGYERQQLRERFQQTRATLNLLADATGGQPLFGGGRTHALEQVVADTRSYYWIGFTPAWRGDDESHRVNVKARGKGLRVRTREGFSDLSRQTEVSMMVESSLLFGNPPSSSPLVAEVGPGKRAGWGKVQVPLKVTVPLQELTFLPEQDGWLAEAELRVAVRDENGATSEIPIVALSLRVETLPEEGKVGTYSLDLKMRNQEHDVVVSVYDVASGAILTTRLTVDPRRR